jgi:hypothetical protein
MTQRPMGTVMRIEHVSRYQRRSHQAVQLLGRILGNSKSPTALRLECGEISCWGWIHLQSTNKNNSLAFLLILFLEVIPQRRKGRRGDES